MQLGVMFVVVSSFTKRSASVDPPLGPTPGDALGGLWPQPVFANASGSKPICLAGPASFTFHIQSAVSSAAQARLEHAFSRTTVKIFGTQTDDAQDPRKSGMGSTTRDTLQALWVSISSSDLDLNVSTNESYTLTVDSLHASLQAHTVYGVLRGLETFSQLTTRRQPGCSSGKQWGINSSHVAIRDAPRFHWRGVMLDTARHFLPITTIERFLDAMEMNKLNVLHWHITDSQSFPLLTNRTPALTMGAYSPLLTYSVSDVRGLVAHAADRGIRIVPELDSPGHATSWAAGYPDAALPACQTLDPSANATYALLDSLLGEVATIFPDAHLHIGADEVDFSCWNSSARVVDYMLSHGIGRDELGFKALTAMYISRLTALVRAHGKVPVAWQEAMDHYGPTKANPTPPSTLLPAETVIEQWLEPPWNWANLSSITGVGYIGRPDALWPAGRTGFSSLVTLGWYLDNTASLNAWEQAYAREPLTNKSCTYSADGKELQCDCKCPSGPWRDGVCHCYDLRYAPAAQTEKVLGGEAPLWGEHIDASNLLPRAFPRASAVAERLWSAMALNNATAATPRLLKHRCRMIQRGIDVTPLGPGSCVGYDP